MHLSKVYMTLFALIRSWVFFRLRHLYLNWILNNLILDACCNTFSIIYCIHAKPTVFWVFPNKNIRFHIHLRLSKTNITIPELWFSKYEIFCTMLAENTYFLWHVTYQQYFKEKYLYFILLKIYIEFIVCLWLLW